jgi:hypothetical protein
MGLSFALKSGLDSCLRHRLQADSRSTTGDASQVGLRAKKHHIHPAVTYQLHRLPPLSAGTPVDVGNLIHDLDDFRTFGAGSLILLLRFTDE